MPIGRATEHAEACPPAGIRITHAEADEHGFMPPRFWLHSILHDAIFTSSHSDDDFTNVQLVCPRFLVIALRSVNCGDDERTDDVFSWSNELYHGEFVDLASSGMLIQDSYPIQPQLKGEEPSDPLNKATIKSTNHKTLEPRKKKTRESLSIKPPP
ncbi:hypothetical protein KSP40_PGU007086 [Platanthera guangdongensis]|uniref:Uncharacterized protein n=1 Tax=Platanthera guangdongensis TaxID=2320717 RepID=A0ABR2MGH1_9ASPA